MSFKKSKHRIDRHGLDKDRGAGIMRSRAMVRSRTCAWCGERDAHVEYLDERAMWMAVCDKCNTPVKDPPPLLVIGPGMSSADRLRAKREHAVRAGLCTMCLCRDARADMKTCEPCGKRSGWEAWHRGR